MKYPPHEMLDTYLFITVSTDIVLNVFLNSLHDCHNFYCFIMSLLQWVIQKSKNVLLPPQDTPQDTPPDTPQDDHTNYGLEKALCHISKCIHTPISCFSGIFVTVWMFYFTPFFICFYIYVPFMTLLICRKIFRMNPSNYGMFRNTIHFTKSL